MGRPRVALENPPDAGTGLGIACLSDALVSEGNMGTKAKHFNGIATADADGVHPVFGRRSSAAAIRYRPVRGGVRAAAI
jgi:hypothetical protein